MMKRIEAIALLARCSPLAAKLSTNGVNIELTTEDWTALQDFNKVWLSGWLKDHDVPHIAGLDHSDIAMLSYKLAVEKVANLHR